VAPPDRRRGGDGGELAVRGGELAPAPERRDGAARPADPMSLGFLIVSSLSLGLAAWLFFVWSVRSGQYDDPEGPKYRMLDDDEEPSSEEPKRDHDPRKDV
jgi:cbb3-type cytochrome oxidase maturation protein